MNPFITYNQFIKLEFSDRCGNPKVAAIYKKSGGFKAFKANYIKSYGFAEYLVHVSGNTLSTIQTYHLAKAFYVYGKRAPSTLPMILASVTNQYQIEYPVIYGILTKDYWQSRFDSALMQ